MGTLPTVQDGYDGCGERDLSLQVLFKYNEMGTGLQRAERVFLGKNKLFKYA